MPDSSGRIRRSAVDCMCNMLLSLTSIYKDADLFLHPRMCVVFNNVSKVYTPETNTFTFDKTGAKKEETEKPLIWKDYIINYKDNLLEALKQYNPELEEEFLEERIVELFPDDNFYFYQVRDGITKEEIELEFE